KASAVSKTTETTTKAHVDYNFTTVETKKVPVYGEETVVIPPVDPDTPDGPVGDETPDEVVTPETPELPPVQDATPDDAAPETPVLPSDAVLPAVQDALPQTGVNWMAALGMAFSGMLLTIAGAFASLKYKEKH
ncbi:MAG: LPXTG cell wall anchor domain-containing protein, partial [Faecalibacterium sp.]|nr:LPXTG cell wall anchor domain-containing protein [Faecalibacterium sp.]